MKKVFEKIRERLEVLKKIMLEAYETSTWTPNKIGFHSSASTYTYAIEIVNQVEEEYKDGHFGCNQNGQHEKCSDCCFRVECKHYGEWWFGNNVSEKPKGEQ